MQFLKKHFEKIILSAVLVGLGAAAFWLSVAVAEAKRSMTAGLISPPAPKPLPGVESNLTSLRDALQKLKEAPAFALSGEHNLFNPVTWKKAADGKLFKMTRAGVDALAVTGITPLYFTIRLQSQAGNGFFLGIQPPGGTMSRVFYTPKDKPTPARPYTIVSTNPAPENPSLLTIQLLIPETGETVSITTNAPYKRVVGYVADLKYSGSDATNVFANKRVDDPLQFSGESFRIITMTSNAVTVQDARTAQRTEMKWKGGQ